MPHPTELGTNEIGQEEHTPRTLALTLAAAILKEIRRGNGKQAFAVSLVALRMLEDEIPEFEAIDRARSAQADRWNRNLSLRSRGVLIIEA